MQARWIWQLRTFTRKLWVRALIFSILGVATALGAVVLNPYIPDDLPTSIGASAVDDILSIIASSMLTVTTFSLSVMVAAFASAATNATPRATRLLTEDTSAHNVVATFLGSFLFALVGLVALHTGIYGDKGRVVLFAATILVIALIVLALLRWFDRLTKFGRINDTAARVEDATRAAMQSRLAAPCFGCTPMSPFGELPKQATRGRSTSIGYVQHVDIENISRIAEALDCDIYLLAQPGAFVDTMSPIFAASRKLDEQACEELRDSFTIADTRTYAQDPRFGLCVLAEIASRALSPGINDAGTAIDILGRLVRLLSEWTQGAHADEGGVRFPRVIAAPLRASDLFDDAFTSIARDGAGIVEIAIRLQKSLRSLAQLDGADVRDAARLHSVWALERAEAALTMEFDKQRVRIIAAMVQSNLTMPSTIARS